MPFSSMTTVASGTVSRIERRWASRAREVGGVFAIANPGAAKLFAEPGDTGADHGEDDGLEHLRVVDRMAAGEQEPKDETKRGRQQPRAKTAKSRQRTGPRE